MVKKEELPDEKLLTLRRELIAQFIAARKDKGLSQTQLAERIGTHRSNISRLESGGHNPSLDLILRIADVLDMKLQVRRNDYEGLYDPLAEPLRVAEDVPKNAYDVALKVDHYELRLYDSVLMKFRITLFDHPREKVIDVLYVNEEYRSLLPLDLKLDNEGIRHWLKRRIIPKNRVYVEQILASLRVSRNDFQGVIDVCKGLSLNDSYWIVPEGFEGSYDEYNLYDNRFSELLSLLAYTGQGQSDTTFRTSPELTTNGMMPKAWRFIKDDGIYLYKGGTSGFANTGNEPYSEFYAAQIAKKMGLNAIDYGLENWKGILASTCKLFTNIDTAFIPIGRIVTTGGINAVLDYYAQLGVTAAEAVHSMLVFDAVIYNEDRHFGNFGVLRNNLNGEIIGAAPIFDNGLSLFCFGMESDFEDLETYASERAPAYYADYSFESLCEKVMGRIQRQQLHRLIGFKFKRHPKTNLPEWRLTAIEEHIQKRVQQLLSL